jgi:hypothetical protein
LQTLPKIDVYRDHLVTIAMTVNKSHRFQPQVHWTPGDGPLEFSIVDTATTDEFGDPEHVGLAYSLEDAIETAYRWTRNPEKCYGNDWSGLLNSLTR